jgi:hypothetical protein
MNYTRENVAPPIEEVIDVIDNVFISLASIDRAELDVSLGRFLGQFKYSEIFESIFKVCHGKPINYVVFAFETFAVPTPFFAQRLSERFEELKDKMDSLVRKPSDKLLPLFDHDADELWEAARWESEEQYNHDMEALFTNVLTKLVQFGNHGSIGSRDVMAILCNEMEDLWEYKPNNHKDLMLLAKTSFELIDQGSPGSEGEIFPDEHDCDTCPQKGNCPIEGIMRAMRGGDAPGLLGPHDDE